MSKDFVPEQSSAEESLEKILEQLNQSDLDELPVEALRAAQSRRDEVIPHLMSFLQNAAQAAMEGDETIYDREGHVFALFLLAEFRATESLPVILNVLSLPDDFAGDLFGEILSIDLGRILAALAGDNLDLIGEYIDRDVIESSIRWGMAGIYRTLVRDGKMSREEAVERLRRHLRKAIQQKDKVVVGGLVYELKDYAAREAREEVARAFRSTWWTCP